MSVRFKFLSIIITLTVLGLGIAGYFSYDTYKKDKLAFVYESLNTTIKDQAKLFSAVAEDHESMLTTFLTVPDLKNENSLSSLRSYLEGDQQKIFGLFLQFPSDAKRERKTIFTREETNLKIDWEAFEQAPVGVSVIDAKDGFFLMKKLVGDNGFGAMIFRHTALRSILDSSRQQQMYLLNQGKVVNGATPLPQATLSLLTERIAKSPGADGLFEQQIESEDFIVSFAKLGAEGLLLFNIVPSKNVLLVQEIIALQVAGFIGLMFSVSLLIGTLASRWLTRQLDTLTEAVREIEDENFDVQVEVTSSDELGSLGGAFNSMTGKIKTLLDELRIYNLELEDKVRERTAELQKLTDIQDGMLNALGQGLVIMDKDLHILPVYSRAAEDMFEVSPAHADPAAIMNVPEADAQSFKELFAMSFEGMMSLDDVVRLAPDLRTNSRDQKIQLSYAPIVGGEDRALQYVMIVGTDKTQEFENMENFKREWSFSQMVQKIAQGRRSLVKLVLESKEMLNYAVSLLSKDSVESLTDIQRQVHTIKGNFSFFHLHEISDPCHELETELSPLLGGANCSAELKSDIKQKLLNIDTAISAALQKYDHLIQYEEMVYRRSVKLSDLQGFAANLAGGDPSLVKEFQNRFFSSRISSYFEMYPSMVSELSSRVGKQVKFELAGGDIEIPEGPWNKIFSELVHFIRNSVDHGIETPEEREQAGKTPFGVITFDFRLENSPEGQSLLIRLSDNGKGIDWKKIAEKDPQVTCLKEALERIQTGGISSRDTVSDLSGRGVGVSAIHASVLALGGESSLESAPGKGFELLAFIPLVEKRSQLKKVA